LAGGVKIVANEINYTILRIILYECLSPLTFEGDFWIVGTMNVMVDNISCKYNNANQKDESKSPL
jgi:hypothetical protein